MLPFLLIAISVTLGWTFGIVFFITKIFLLTAPYRPILVGFSLILSLLFILGVLGTNVSSSPIYIWLYRIGSVWMGAVTLAFVVTLIFFIGAVVSGHLLDSRGVTIGFFALVLLLNIWGIFASFSSVVVSSEVTLKNPGNWAGKKIVMVSDNHYGHIYGVSDARKLVTRINTLHPDIVLIPGDFFDGPKIDFRAITQEFKNIQAPHGVLFANGNHEEYRNTEGMLEALSAAHIQLLNNRMIEIDGVQFAGVSYHDTETASGLTRELDGLHLDNQKSTILLKHKPTLVSEVEKYPIDLVVSGHTHKGQMWPFSLITYATYGKYHYGSHAVNDRLTWITSSGVGSWGPPQRIGSRSEIWEVVVR